MKYALLVLYTLASITQQHQKVTGAYYSIGDGFEKHSRIILKPEGIFIYSAGVSGCQVEVTGQWRVEGNKLYLVNNEEFQNNPTDTSRLRPFYPDMSLTAWKISANSIKPLRPVNSGCMVDSKKHIRGK